MALPRRLVGGANRVKLIKYTRWTEWSGVPLGEAGVPPIGTGWRHLAPEVVGDQLRVTSEGLPVIGVRDRGHEGRSPYPRGGIGLEFRREGRAAAVEVAAVRVRDVTARRSQGRLRATPTELTTAEARRTPVLYGLALASSTPWPGRRPPPGPTDQRTRCR